MTEISPSGEEGCLPSGDDRKLLSGLRGGRIERLEAIEAIAARYGAELSRVAYLTLGDFHAAQDAAQDTLIAAWDAAARTNEATRLRPWLFAILVNRCRSMLRTQVRRRRREEERGRWAIPDEGGDERTRELSKVMEAVSELEPELREVMILRFDRELSVAETAEALGIAEGTVKSRTHSAVEKIRKRVGMRKGEAEREGLQHDV